MKAKVPVRFTFENEYWSAMAGGNIIEVVIEEDMSIDYEVEAKHLYKLDNNKWAVVWESGCSCYSMSDANIATFNTLKEAKEVYNGGNKNDD